MIKFVINGNFLSQRVTGIQRYAYELTCALDKMAEGISLELYVPSDVDADLSVYREIKITKSDKPGGLFWEQIVYPLYLRKRGALGVNLCNVVPMLSPKGITCIHDIGYKVNPHFFKRTLRARLSRLWHCANYYVIAKSALSIITVSEFSRKEILAHYKIAPEKVTVAPNAWQHFAENNIDQALLGERFSGLNPGSYYFSMCSIEPNKNIKWIIDAARFNPDAIFVIAGAYDSHQCDRNAEFDKLSNVVFLGCVSDRDAQTLMSNAKAFLFPTLYEGFGLPPMEAMCLDVDCVVSDIPVMREIYGSSVHYIDPCNSDIDLDSLLNQSTAPVSEVLEKYSWDYSARILADILTEVSK